MIDTFTQKHTTYESKILQSFEQEHHDCLRLQTIPESDMPFPSPGAFQGIQLGWSDGGRTLIPMSIVRGWSSGQVLWMFHELLEPPDSRDRGFRLQLNLVLFPFQFLIQKKIVDDGDVPRFLVVCKLPAREELRTHAECCLDLGAMETHLLRQRRHENQDGRNGRTDEVTSEGQSNDAFDGERGNEP